MLPLQLRPPTATSRLLTCCSSLRLESLLRPITGFGDGVQVWALALHRGADDPLHTQQLRGDASAWWANYTATRPVDYQVSWADFRDAFRAHYILVGMMRKKR
jgi:hypothetical protein